jgi:hypothetical protein
VLGSLGQENALIIQAFLLMRNHFHLLWSPYSLNDGACRDKLIDKFSEVFELKMNHGKIFYPILSFPQYAQVYKYIYRNPVEAGVVMKVEDYAYSTLQIVLGNQPKLPGLEDPFGVIFDQHRMLQWLNSPYSITFSRGNHSA